MCGVNTTFSRRDIGSSAAGGSDSRTSRPAAAIQPSVRARTSACWSMISPRAVLINTAFGFIKRNWRSPITDGFSRTTARAPTRNQSARTSHRSHLLDTQLFHRLLIDDRVESDDLQFQTRHLPGDQAGDAAEANQAERIANKVPIGPRPVSVPDPLADQPVLLCDPPDHSKQQTDGVLGDLVHGRLGGVGHDDSQPRRHRDRDVVGAGAGAQDCPALVQEGQDLGCDHPRAAH